MAAIISQNIFLSLVRACKEGKVLGKLYTRPYFDWTELARNAAAGHIRTLTLYEVKEIIQKTRKGDPNAAWEIAEKLEFIIPSHNCNGRRKKEGSKGNLGGSLSNIDGVKTVSNVQ